MLTPNRWSLQLKYVLGRRPEIQSSALRTPKHKTYSSWFLGAYGRAGHWPVSLEVFKASSPPKAQELLTLGRSVRHGSLAAEGRGLAVWLGWSAEGVLFLPHMAV